MAPRLSLAAGFLSLLASVLAQAPYKENSPECDCYYINSDNNPLYFVNHRFYDFRQVANSSSQYTSQPPQLNNTNAAAHTGTQDQQYLNSSSWLNDWGIQNWYKPGTNDTPVNMQNSPTNVFMMQTNADDLESSDPSDTTFLTLRTTRFEDFQSAAEMENEDKNLMYASLRMRARVKGAAGAVAGFFTYYDDNNESDIEILTTDNETTWNFSDQPSVDKENNAIAASLITPPNLPSWRDWHEYRFDWTPHVVRWFIDGKYAAQNTYSVPSKPLGLVLNMWSDGGNWSGNMSVGDSAELQIQWIELAFNTSGPRGGPGVPGTNKRGLSDHPAESVKDSSGGGHCNVTCKIDGVNKTGFPLKIAQASAARHEVVSLMGWAVIAFAGAFTAITSL